MFLRRLYVLVVIEHTRRRAYIAGITANLTGTWVTQQPATCASLGNRAERSQFLIRDRDSKFTRRLRRDLHGGRHPRHPHRGSSTAAND